MLITLQKLILIFMRIGAFIFISKGFSFKGVPTVVKIAISLGLSLPVYAVIPAMESELGLVQLALFALKESLVGLALGYITNLFFYAVEIAGNFADFQVGFSMSAVFDPALGFQASYFGKIYYWMALSIFFFTDMHHHVLRALVSGFAVFPIEAFSVGDFGVKGIVTLFSMMFEIALNLSAPIVIVALLTEVVLGVLSRTVPQINVLMLSMPLKILVSMSLMLVLLPNLMDSMTEMLPLMVKYMTEFIQSLS